MRTWIVSYGDASFHSSLRRLMASAERFGIEERRAWTREALQQTWLYAAHHAVLDQRRGSGYWLWKPFMIGRTLKEMADGDLLMYSDAGIEIVTDPKPLFDICADAAEILLFAGHYDDVGGPGPNLCGKWTKRDCFVLMGCDERRYHEGQMLDASLVILKKTRRVEAFVREWFLYCCQPQVLTDDPNVCGLPNLRQFIAHRHDQSVLSVLAIREGLELFRHPSQYGNHLKMEPFRVDGEFTRHPYGSKGVYENSPYGTLVDHHRGHVGGGGLRVHLQRVLPASRDRVFRAWTSPDVLMKWLPLGYRLVSVTADVRVDGRYRFVLATELHNERPLAGAHPTVIGGSYLAVEPPARLVYSWPWDTTVTVNLAERGDTTAVELLHEPFVTERLRDTHAAGWQAFLDNLASELSRDRSAPSSCPDVQARHAYLPSHSS